SEHISASPPAQMPAKDTCGACLWRKEMCGVKYIFPNQVPNHRRPMLCLSIGDTCIKISTSSFRLADSPKTVWFWFWCGHQNSSIVIFPRDTFLSLEYRPVKKDKSEAERLL